MKPLLTYLGLFFLLTSCVSKKKYATLNQQHQQTLNDKVTLEDVLAKLSVDNDSLKKQIAFLDSMLYVANIKKNSSGTVTAASGMATKTKTTISKSQEYDTKALYIYSITKYVFWPSTLKADNFLIGVIGDTKLNGALASHIYGKKIHGMPALIEPYNPASKKFYHVVVIADGSLKEFNKTHKQLQGQPVLLIAENTMLEKVSAHISIYPAGDKIKFKVNDKLIQKAGLNVSGMLLELAETTGK